MSESETGSSLLKEDHTKKRHWYKASHPIEPYAFRDFQRGLVGYSKKQKYQVYQYIGHFTYVEACIRAKKHNAIRKDYK